MVSGLCRKGGRNDDYHANISSRANRWSRLGEIAENADYVHTIISLAGGAREEIEWVVGKPNERSHLRLLSYVRVSISWLAALVRNGTLN